MHLKPLIIGLFLAFPALAGDSLKEPPLKLTLTIDGKSFSMTPGGEKRIEGEFKNPLVKVEAGAVRTFAYGGISFDYPAGCNWEAEVDEASHTWTIEGPDVTIIVTRSEVKIDAETIADSFLEQTGIKGKKSEIVETHGGREFKGWKTSGKLAQSDIVVRVLSIPVKAGGVVVQIIDTPDEPGGESDEFRSTMDLLGKTLRSDAK